MVGARLAGSGAIDCGSVAVGGDASALNTCMASAFTSGHAFFGFLDEATPSDAILVRGFIRNDLGQLREIVGTRQGARTVVHTRNCFSAVVTSGVLTCTNEMDGLFIECDCTNTNDGGTDASVGPTPDAS